MTKSKLCKNIYIIFPMPNKMEYVYVHIVCRYTHSHTKFILNFKPGTLYWVYQQISLFQHDGYGNQWYEFHLPHFLVYTSINSQLGDFDFQYKESMKERRISLRKHLEGVQCLSWASLSSLWNRRKFSNKSLRQYIGDTYWRQSLACTSISGAEPK
jgi:hypothetical protein